MALFGRKKTNEAETAAETAGSGPGAGAGAGSSAAAGAEGYQPEKAAKFFRHAATVHDSTNYEYAVQLWIQGLRFDPQRMSAIEGLFRSAQEFSMLPVGKKGPSRDMYKAARGDGRGDIDRYLTSLLEWSVRPLDPVPAVRAMDAAARLGLHEPAYWIGERAMGAILREKKPRKDLLVKLLDYFKRINAYDKAVEAGEAARRLDPTDGALAAEVRNLSASATMARGGYEQAGQEGGFRANIRDFEKQRLLEDQDRIVKTEETVDRLVRQAQQDYEAEPDDANAVRIYAKRLLERGRDEDEKLAFEILGKAYESTKQFMFRQMAGEIRLRRARRALAQRRDAAEASPGDESLKEAHAAAVKKFQEMEIEEYRAQVEAYPTDLSLKYELGRRYFEQEKFEESIPLFQESQNEIRTKVASLSYLGRAFLKIGFVDGAVQTFRRALESHKAHDDEVGMDLRYGLVAALKAQAEQERDVAAAEEADRLASSIAIQQFNYRDIRQVREALKKLLSELRAGAA